MGGGVLASAHHESATDPGLHLDPHAARPHASDNRGDVLGRTEAVERRQPSAAGLEAHPTEQLAHDRLEARRVVCEAEGARGEPALDGAHVALDGTQ